MTKYTDNFESQFKDIRKIQETTRDIIKNGGKLALKEFHEASSIERLKRRIMEE